MELSLATPEGDRIEVTPQELPQDVADARHAFDRVSGANPSEAEKTRPPKRAARELADDTSDPGYTPNKRGPGRPRKEDQARTTTKAPSASPKATKTVKAQTDAERKEGVKGLVQIGSGVLLLVDQRTPETDVSFKADAYVLATNADAIADAVVETAKSNEGFARALDKITAAGPYAALTAVMFSVGMQIAANHGVPMARAMGAADPHDVVTAFEAAA